MRHDATKLGNFGLFPSPPCPPFLPTLRALNNLATAAVFIQNVVGTSTA